ncbi:peptidyl-prolyl cis-trans isomerase E [Tribonema minus]|uniref:Peptidyl-prolyl cis-trans isomerase E n=1 Tax=Tribonema minus TaxID=303371 RepID=A0A835Z2R3_9STRA|nr:peptidyl-prolyl cis-trans isomerase E [Tribonema minus]|eukprot:TRINITY_DN749_c0_g1_i1.p3 TRINITY_DN749_c0_g1~~TRINITY_DN749_c0_g1_i1.p3  ORF type:complete len:137 (-),score=65.50 TRINITY_DN749_c0_g1_i1:33-443(-)
MEGGKPPRCTLYVGGLEENVNEELLHAAFIPFGDLVEVQIPREWKSGTNRGFGFVEYEAEEDASAAMENMDGAELAGRVLRVNRAKPLKHKLGAARAVWSADEWFKNMAEGDETINMTADDMPQPDALEPVAASEQ